MLKLSWIAGTVIVTLLLSSAQACSVSVNPDTGEITAAPQNATSFSAGSEVLKSGGAGGGGGSPVMSLPQASRGGSPRDNARNLARTYNHMLHALDPDLKKADGEELDPYERTFRFQSKLSQAAEVMHALDVVARVEAGKKATDEEVQRAEEVLAVAIKDLTDDVPESVRAEVLHDPRKVWMIAFGGLIAFAIGCAALYLQKQRQMAAA